MSYIKALLFLAAVVVAAYGEEAPRVKKQILVGAYADDGSYWPGKYDVRELSPALGALPDGAAVRTAIPAVLPHALPAAIPHALPALAAPYHYPYLI